MTADRDLIHHVCASLHSPPRDTPEFDAVQAKALKIERYAKRLGFEVMYENVDEVWDP